MNLKNIFVSCIKGKNDDYDTIKKRLNSDKSKDNKEDIEKKIQYKLQNESITFDCFISQEYEMLLICGAHLQQIINDKNKFNPEIVYTQLVDLINEIIGQLNNGKEEEKIKFDKNTLLCIHWGGQKGLKYNNNINNYIKKLDSENTPIQLVTYFSSTDDKYFTKEGIKIEDAMKFYRNRAVGFKKKIYEVMETICIMGYPEFLRKLNQNRENDINITLVDPNIKHLVTDFLSKNFENELKNRHENLNTEIEKFFKNTRGMIGIEENHNNHFINITDLNQFRSDVNELLNVMSGEIYPKLL